VNNRFLFRSRLTHIRTVEDVIHQMTTLDEELTHSALHNLKPFNLTYKIITTGVKELFGTGYFQDDELMQALDVRFADYFFSPLYAYVNGHPLPPAWKTLFDLCPHNSVFQAIYMGMGVNAHVNNDLGQALNDVIYSPNYLTDFLKVNTIIRNKTHEVVSSLNEKGLIVNKVKNGALPIYSALLQHTIEMWRTRAWNIFLKLQTRTISIQEVEKQAQQTALILTRIPKITV